MARKQAPFTTMVITDITDKKTIDNITYWLLSKITTPELSPLPFEMWQHIISFLPQEKCKDGDSMII